MLAWCEALGAERLAAARALRGGVLRAGDMENRIKEQQLALFADRTSAQTQCGTIRLKLLKIGVRIRGQRAAVRLSFDEGFPEAASSGQVLARLQSLPLRC